MELFEGELPTFLKSLVFCFCVGQGCLDAGFALFGLKPLLDLFNEGVFDFLGGFLGHGVLSTCSAETFQCQRTRLGSRYPRRFGSGAPLNQF